MEISSVFRFPFGGQRQLKAAVAHLASLQENEIATITGALTQIEAPINSRAIKTASEHVHEKISRLSDDESESVIALLLQMMSTDDFIEFLDDLEVIEDDQRTKLQKVLGVVKSSEILRKTIAIDKLLERGPRLQHMRWFCDIRTQFTDSSRTGDTSGTYVPKEEVQLPVIIIRMKIDEVDRAVYFQMSGSELDEHIAVLQRARDELRCVEKGREH